MKKKKYKPLKKYAKSKKSSKKSSSFSFLKSIFDNKKTSKYKSLFSSAPTKTEKNIKKNVKSKYKSLFKEIDKKEVKKLDNTLEKVNKVKKIRKTSNLNPKKMAKILRQQATNTLEQFDLQATQENRPLISSWLSRGVRYDYNQKRKTITIFPITVAKNKRVRIREYTYLLHPQRADQIWEEMKEADKPDGGGAGTVFWKYKKKGLIRETKTYSRVGI